MGEPGRGVGLSFRGSDAQWIIPLEALEAAEVRVRRAQCQPVLDGDGRQVCVGNEVRAVAYGRHEGGQNLVVVLRGFRGPYGWALQPLLDLPPGVIAGHGAVEDPGIRDQAHERHQARPGQADRRDSVEPLVEPASCRFVLSEVLHSGVDEEVGVNEDQRKSSPSPTARASPTSSSVPTRHRPREEVGVW